MPAADSQAGRRFAVDVQATDRLKELRTGKGGVPAESRAGGLVPAQPRFPLAKPGENSTPGTRENTRGRHRAVARRP